MLKNFVMSKKSSTFAPAFRLECLARLGNGFEKRLGTLAQVVEQWTENPCVLGSTPWKLRAITAYVL